MRGGDNVNDELISPAIMPSIARSIDVESTFLRLTPFQLRGIVWNIETIDIFTMSMVQHEKMTKVQHVQFFTNDSTKYAVVYFLSK